MFENVDRQTTDARVTGILIGHLGAFGSGELKTWMVCGLFRIILMNNLFYMELYYSHAFLISIAIASIHPTVMLSPPKPKPLDKIEQNLVCELLIRFGYANAKQFFALSPKGLSVCLSVRLSITLSPSKPLHEIQPNFVCEWLTCMWRSTAKYFCQVKYH